MFTPHSRQHSGVRRQIGFTLIEVMISIVILTVGLLSLLAVMGVAMSATQTAKADLIAQQLAQQALESIYTARDTANEPWQVIQNVGTGQIPDGIFVTGFNPILQAGADGIYGTTDDATPEVLQDPGPDGILNTGDDVFTGLTNYQRKILIQNTDPQGNVLSPNLRYLTITIQYTTPQSKAPKQYVLSGYISSYR